MSKLFVSSLGLVLLLALGACSGGKGKKSSARIYGGDAPTIKYGDQQETPGGYIHTY